MDKNLDPTIFQVMENRIKSGGIWTAPTTSGPMAEALKKEMPEVAYAITTRPSGNITLTVGEKNIKASGNRVGKDFFQVFNYPLLAGNKTDLLATNQDIVLSDELAQRLFGSVANALGKTLDWQHEEHYRVSGIFKALGAHNSEPFDFLLSIQSTFDQQEGIRQWSNTGVSTYVRLKEGTSTAQFNRKIAGFVKSKSNGTITHRTPFVFAYRDLYLHGNFENGVSGGGRISYVNLFSIIAVFILIIACINFINLSTARAVRRAKEVGIKKVAGASRGNLVLQYLSESLMITLLSVLLAVVLVVLLLPAFNNITGKMLHLEMDAGLLGVLVGLTIFTGVLAGSYPAIYLSGFNPGLVLKGKSGGAGGERMARKGLVVFQFTLSVVLIVSVLAVYKQINYMQNRNLGFNREHILTLPIEGKMEDATTRETFMSEMRQVPGVIHATGIGHSLTGHNSGTFGVKWPGRDPADKTEFENMAGDYDLIETLGMQVKEGRSFSRNFKTDSSAIIFNEAAIAYMNIKDPVGKTVQLWGEPRIIIGIVKNFHYESLHKAITPVFLRLSPESNFQLMARIQPGKEKAVIDRLSVIYSRFNPGFGFEYGFLDERFKTLYLSEQRVAVLSRYFAGLAILISCLGLFGLAAYTAQSRRKEIAIRKVIGATIKNIVLMLSGDFLKLILIAVLIAFPFSWWAVNKWMAGFAYHAAIGYSIFLIAAVSILAITFATIGFQSLKAALASPSGSLKDE